MKRTLLALGLLIATSAAHAQVPDGEYISQFGRGSMTVTKGGFEISSVGANGHTCGLSGDFKNGVGVVDEGPDACRIAFKKKGDGYDVTPLTLQNCRTYCGARASFDGLYLKPAPGCADSEREATQKAFKTAYDAKQYAKAEPLLTRMLRDCTKTLSAQETATTRNDIAITQYHLGKKAECLKTLAPLAKEAARSDESLKDDYPPSDWADYQPVVKATRTNLALCRK